MAKGMRVRQIRNIANVGVVVNTFPYNNETWVNVRLDRHGAIVPFRFKEIERL